MPEFVLTTRTTTYAMAVDDAGLLRTVHWGGRIDDVSDLIPLPMWDLSTNDMYADIAAEEYPVHGRFRYKEQCLAVTFADGTREMRPVVTGSTELDDDDGRHLVLHLEDSEFGVTIDLHYVALHDLDLIERWAVIGNTGPEPFTIEAAASAQFHVPFQDLTFRNMHGMWAAELQEFSQQVSYGKIVVESRKGVSNHNHNPSFILDDGADETSGQVWFGALKYPGNFKAVVEQSQYGGTAVQIGINDYDFALRLVPGQSLRTPAVVAGYSDSGLGTMSHRMHAYGRDLMRPALRDVLYNSWEATSFDVTTANQTRLAQLAQRIGAELFVVDDGWFGRRGAEADGLGDWWVNRDKFPDGLTPLIDEVQQLGMRFGIWVEPEMVNPRADLYRDHPDWIHRDPVREPDTARDQYVLNLALPAVQEFVVEMLDDLLSTNDISYVKWDANRPMSQVGVDRSVWLAHARALIDVVARIKDRHPDVMIEACASGGGRIDLGTLSVFDDFWTSDNTDALDRLTIQRSYSLLYPIKAMRAWVTDSPNFLTQRSIPLKFRFHSAMMGTLGIGADLSHFSDEDLETSTQLVAQYKDVRETIQNGDFHRLSNPSPNDYRLFQYSRPEQSVLFAFLPSSRIGRRGTRARLRGLDPDARYRFYANWAWQQKSGAWLMHHGIDLWLMGDYASEIITVDRIGQP